ncbi:MAG TPA: hypothetical protein VF006_09535 [Longimicrobium sp.]
MFSRMIRFGAVAGIAALAMACEGSPTGGGGGGGGGGGVRIGINPVLDTLDAVGDTRTLNAQVIGTTEAPVWQSLAPGIVEITPSGRVTAMSPGTALIRATVAGKTAEAQMTVRPSGAVTVASGSVRAAAYASDEVTLTLLNTGGRAVYRLEFWGLRTSPTGPHRLFATSEPLEVAPSYNQTVKYTVPVRTSPDVDWVIVYTRDPGSATYRRTACYRFLPGGTDCPVI